MQGRSTRLVANIFLLLIPARVVSSQGLPFTAFGPATYARATGAPSTEQATFSVLNPNATYVLHAVPPAQPHEGAQVLASG